VSFKIYYPRTKQTTSSDLARTVHPLLPLLNNAASPKSSPSLISLTSTLSSPIIETDPFFMI